MSSYNCYGGHDRLVYFSFTGLVFIYKFTQFSCTKHSNIGVEKKPPHFFLCGEEKMAHIYHDIYAMVVSSKIPKKDKQIADC